METTKFVCAYPSFCNLRREGSVVAEHFRNYSALFEASALNTKAQRHKGTKKAGEQRYPMPAFFVPLCLCAFVFNHQCLIKLNSYTFSLLDPDSRTTLFALVLSFLDESYSHRRHSLLRVALHASRSFLPDGHQGCGDSV